MPGKPRRGITLSHYERWSKEGRGRGEFESYQPWVTVRDFPSRGVSAMVPGTKVHRTHHLFSRLELRAFLHYEFLSEVIDIREQFPLLPLSVGQRIAKEMGIRYPRHTDTGTPIVLCADFLITRRVDGKQSLLAVECKYRSEIDAMKKRDHEKLELRRRYWEEENGVSLKLFTDETVSFNRYVNLKALYQVARPNALRSPSNEKKLLNALSSTPWKHCTLKVFLTKAGTACGLSYRDSFELFKHLIWNKRVVVDLETLIKPTRQLPHLLIRQIERADVRLEAKAA